MKRQETILKKVLAKSLSGLLSSLMVLGLAACQLLYSSPAYPTPRPAVDIDMLQFTDAQEGQRFRSLNTCIENMVDSTWHSTSYELHSNFHESKWCRGAGVDADCETASGTADKRDQHVLELYTLYVDRDYPQVFGLGISAERVPASTGWAARFSFSENGDGVVGDFWGVNFSDYTSPTGPPEATIYFSQGYSYRVRETTINYSAGLPIRDDLALYMSGPEAMRDRGLAQIEALAQKVREEIIARRDITCDRGPYLGNGAEPVCTPRPLSPAEQASELARADAYFTGQIKLLQDHYQEMYAAWMNAFPLDQCWP